MARQGSEAAHDEKLRELAGPAADFVFSATKKYPKLDADVIQAMIGEGFVCVVKDGDIRLVIYRHDSQVHALVTEFVHAGYRRRYRKLSAATAAEVISELR